MMTSYAEWLKNIKITNNIEEADIIMFTGGEDVSPELYGCEKHITTYCNKERDIACNKLFEKSQKLPNKPLLIGICRGSQYLTVANGGKLIQNVNNHAIWGTHNIVFNDESYQITSTHHQMMYPFDLNNEDYKILAYAAPKRSTIYEGDGIDIPPVEPEIVFYPKTNCLCIQGHPEMMNNECKIVRALNNLVETLIINNNE